MDRIDKFVNNRSPKRTVIAFLAITVFSAILSFILSCKIADFVAHEQLMSYLSTVDSEKASQYGFSSGMSLKLVPIWAKVRNISFFMMLSAMILCAFLWVFFAVHEVFSIYDELELLSSECIKSADKLDNIVSLHGEAMGCVRRISESARLLAGRMVYLDKCIEQERNYISQFFGDFSHQIKTALAIVRLNTDMLAETENLPPKYCEQLSDEIQLNLDSMENLVVQAIKIARLESQAIEYDMQELDLSDTCRMALKRMAPVLRDKQIRTEVNFQQGIKLKHDKGWLCEAIENVLKNSADHSDCTAISVETEENPVMIKLSVIDNGKGIPQKEIPHLFEAFAKKSRDITMKSAGMGMSIAQKIVRNHGGEIIVYSTIGKGTRFEFVFVKI
ncbi:MAG: HAMP domain-containing histidine kinase [Ruminococcus sp.]|nr:HAMP domain-containing histidine kinase [Ruminococcus sp.]